MSTLSQISRAVQEIRQLLHNSLTPEFFRSIKETCDAINELLSDPSIKANLSSSLAELNKLLAEANKQGLVKESLDLVKQIQRVLGEVDMEAVNTILLNIGSLLEQAKEAKLIEHFVDALKAAKSIGEFFELSKKVSEKVIGYGGDYGVFVPVIGTALYKITSIYLNKKDDSELVKLMRENNGYSALNVLTSLQSLRATHLIAYVNITHSINKGVYDNDELLSEMSRERDYAKRVVQSIPQMDEKNLKNLSDLNTKLENLLSHFVESEIKNESLQDVLGYMGASYQQYMDPLLKYVVYSSQSLPGKPVKPEMSRYERNYLGTCRYYGKEQIDSVMMGLAGEYVKNGGDDLYYVLANSFENAPSVFIDLAKYIALPREFELDVEQYNAQPAYIKALREYYNQGAEQYIREALTATKWPIGLEYLKDQLGSNDADTNITIDIIKARAFAEFCHNTSSYFFGYHYVARDVGKGLLDVPTGLFNTLAHPLQTIRGVGRLFTLNGWADIGKGAWNRPWRFASSLAPGLAVGGYASFHAMAPTTQTIEAIQKINQYTKHTAYSSNSLNLATPIPTVTTSVVTSQSASLATTAIGTINSMANTTQNTVRSNPMESSNHANVESSEMKNTTSQGRDNVWFLLLPELGDARTAADFYKMISALPQEIDRRSESFVAMSLPKASQNGFFSSSSTISSELDVSSSLASVMHHSK